MDMMEVLRGIGCAKNFKSTSNFYYDDHICGKSGDNIRIRLDYVLSNEVTDDVLRLGVCPDCGLCLYHRDHQSSGL
ncbi:MAG: hypothetical protein IKS17_02015 [Firmicutes bacterium]|nr:hypothetical protein [Bacillota bacterium]